MTVATVTPNPIQTSYAPSVLPPGVAMLQQWAIQAQAAMELAEMLAETPFVPDSYRKVREVERPRNDGRGMYRAKEVIQGPDGVNKQTVAAAILYGAGIGFDPLQALARVVIVKGKASLYAEAMQALLLQHGYDVEITKQDPRECVVQARQPGRENWYTSSWTLDRANKAGYVRGNPKYETDPIAMLTARALSEACRRVAPNLLMGLASADEMEQEPAEGTVSVEQVQPEVAKPPRAKRAAAKSAAPEIAPPPLPEDDGPPDIEPSPGEMVQAAVVAEVERRQAEETHLTAHSGIDPNEALAAVLAAPPARPQEPEQEPDDAADSVTPYQARTLLNLASQVGYDHEARVALATEVCGRDVPNMMDLTAPEASEIITRLRGMLPPGDDD